MAKIRVLLADDHTLFREGVKHLLSTETDIEVVGEASNGAEAIHKAEALRPDVALMDIGMPGLPSFEAARTIRKANAATKVIFLTMYDDEEYLRDGMEAGGSGYVLKDSAASQLVGAIRDVSRGGSYLSPKMLSQFVEDFRSRLNSPVQMPRFSTLTPREKEVLKLLAEGQSVKEVACMLDLSVKTVEAHKFNLMRKLDIHNKAQLVQYAIQKKMIQVPVFA